jgi:hypothetical protein
MVRAASSTSTFSLNLAGMSWDATAIEQELGISIPENIQNIAYEGHQGRGGFLDLSLTASLVDINQLISQPCDNNYYEGYDPFNAIDVGEPFSYTHQIEIGLYPYYSYSPDTPEIVLGNRCQLTTGAVYQVRVDTADPNSTVLRLYLSFSCELCQNLHPMSLKPISDFPLQVLGLRQEGETYDSTSNEICFGLDFSIASLRDEWAYLLGGRISTLIDDRLSTSAYIADDGILMPRYDGAGNFVSVEDSGNHQYYCYEVHWQSGSHVMLVEVTTPSGEVSSYAWNFELQTPA